ncbi:MAG: hypothetical protein HRT57_11345 [Crocinitomicaceae bacterium]|nr:hypothetical protein [Crocinitomicaceae bacterium]
MKKILLFTALTLTSGTLFAQFQIGNADMENWEVVSSGDEPVNWNSFMTASGTFNGFADIQIEESTDVRPGTTGFSSARIWARDAGFGITANGNMTVGKINMGAITANDPANHNFTVTGDADFSEAMTNMPDSIVFWAKFNASGGSEEARMKATVHDDYDYIDPEDANSTAEVVGTAVVNFTSTSGWVRMAIPFDYSGAATNIEYILVTFTTNAVPGGGDPNDELFIDDVELIYDVSSVEENNAFAMNVFMNNETSELSFKSGELLDGNYEVYYLAGSVIMSGDLDPNVPFSAPAGMYIVNVTVGNVSKQFKVYNN